MHVHNDAMPMYFWLGVYTDVCVLDVLCFLSPGLGEAMHWLMPVMQERKFLLPWQKAERRY